MRFLLLARPIHGPRLERSQIFLSNYPGAFWRHWDRVTISRNSHSLKGKKKPKLPFGNLGSSQERLNLSDLLEQ